MPVILETGALPSVTAEDLITRAYRILGDLGSGETLTAHQKDTGLAALNAMLDSFTIERLMIYEIQQTAYTWPASTTSRTIGSGGDFDDRRPDRIMDGTYFKDSNNISYPVTVVRDRALYDGIPDKTVESSYPEMLFYDPTVSLATIYLYPIPNQSLTMYLNTYGALQVFDSLSEAHILPPGYREMIQFNLAVRLEAEAGLPCPMEAKRIAMNTKKAIKRHNNIPTYSNTEVAYVLDRTGRSDIVAGV